jgi:hypothetical protein
VHPIGVKPPAPGIYPVEVMIHEPFSGELLGVATRFAKWTGQWWCAWAVDERRAQMCDAPLGPIQGYRWENRS